MRLRYFDSGGHFDDSGHFERERSFDDTAARSTLIFANGLGGPVTAFRPHMTRLAGSHRLVSWDYRGLYASRLPPGDVDLSIEAHARDVLELADRSGIESFSFVGWSMGVQIGLELARRASHRLDSLVLLNGTYGRPLRGLPIPFAEPLLGPLTRRLGPFHRLGSRVLEGASRVARTRDVLAGLGVIAPSFDARLFDEMLAEFKTLDLGQYLRMLESLYVHDASDVLAQMNVPTLLVSGTRDRITPPALMQTMAERIRDAEFLLIPGATHYAAVEFPDLVTARIERFLRERARAPAPSRLARDALDH